MQETWEKFKVSLQSVFIFRVLASHFYFSRVIYTTILPWCSLWKQHHKSVIQQISTSVQFDPVSKETSAEEETSVTIALHLH